MAAKIKNAMLIDDEKIDQKSFQRILNRTGLIENFLIFTYADEALEYLKENADTKFDIIFLDLNMPRMNGFEFLETASADLGDDFAEAIIVMLTTPIGPVSRERAEKNPLVRGFFDKPFTSDHFSRAVNLLQDA